ARLPWRAPAWPWGCGRGAARGGSPPACPPLGAGRQTCAASSMQGPRAEQEAAGPERSDALWQDPRPRAGRSSAAQPSPFGTLPGSGELRSFFRRPIVDLLVVTAVFAGTVVYAVSTIVEDPATSKVIAYLEFSAQLVFLFEWLLRWYSQNCRPSYLLDASMIIDGLSFLPLLSIAAANSTGFLTSGIGFLTSGFEPGTTNLALSCLRLARILRLQRFLRNRRSVTSILGLLGLVSPDDLATPLQLQGRFAVSLSIVFGISLIPLSLSKLVEEFSAEALASEDSEGNEDGPPPMTTGRWNCLSCGEVWHSAEANFCFRCGTPLRRRRAGLSIGTSQRAGLSIGLSMWRRVLQFCSAERRMADYRGISLPSSVLEWYTNCLVILHEGTCHAPQWSSLGTFGFRTGCACAQITAPFRNLHAKSWEWQEKFPIYTFIGDILMAFDFLRPAAVGRSMERRGMHPRLIAGFLRESRGLKMIPSFHNAPAVPEIDFNKCERMGGTDTT
ncbi:unnamed protein product, partial [Prorocentrum cordatum]